jgi:hypothetical protein
MQSGGTWAMLDGIMCALPLRPCHRRIGMLYEQVAWKCELGFTCWRVGADIRTCCLRSVSNHGTDEFDMRSGVYA